MVSFTKYILATLAIVHQGLAETAPEVSVPNGDFEVADLSQWYTPNPRPENPKTSIVSPGYLSNHALQFSVPASNNTSFSFINKSVGKQIQNSYYRVNFALNWGTYSGPSATNDIGCRVFIQSSYCFTNINGERQVYANSGEGWNLHSYTCMAPKSGLASYTIDFNCYGNATYQVPAFDMQLDALEISLIQSS